jgi:hypothetical protein
MSRPVKRKTLAVSKRPLKEYLEIGFVQTVIDGRMAWRKPQPRLHMSRITERKVWQEIKKGFVNLKDHSIQPNIVILPELTLPTGRLNDLKGLCMAIRSVVIAGLDFEVIGAEKVRNRAVILVPQRWPDKSLKVKRASRTYFGKAFPSDYEKSLIADVNGQGHPSQINFMADLTMYILDAGRYGTIGVAICSDFYDIERFLIYKGRIHHMIVIAHNKDTNSFYFLAEAISRLVYCNVVICNTGFYGDSLAFCPYYKAYERIIYRHEGQGLFSTQVIKLPVFELDQAQRGNDPEGKFKSRPPGYSKLN